MTSFIRFNKSAAVNGFAPIIGYGDMADQFIDAEFAISGDIIRGSVSSFSEATINVATLALGPAPAAPGAPPPPTQAELLAYADAKWSAVLEAGHVTVEDFQSLTGETWQGYIARAVQRVQNNSAAVTLWNGTTPITPAQLVALGDAVGEFVQEAFNVNGTLSTAITAGTITTTAQIDAAPWPVSS